MLAVNVDHGQRVAAGAGMIAVSTLLAKGPDHAASKHGGQRPIVIARHWRSPFRVDCCPRPSAHAFGTQRTCHTTGFDVARRREPRPRHHRDVAQRPVQGWQVPTKLVVGLHDSTRSRSPDTQWRSRRRAHHLNRCFCSVTSSAVINPASANLVSNDCANAATIPFISSAILLTGLSCATCWRRLSGCRNLTR